MYAPLPRQAPSLVQPRSQPDSRWKGSFSLEDKGLIPFTRVDRDGRMKGTNMISAQTLLSSVWYVNLHYKRLGNIVSGYYEKNANLS